MSSEDQAVQHVKKTAISYATDWGSKLTYCSLYSMPSFPSHTFLFSEGFTHSIGSPLPPMLLATLITALHARPFRPVPMVFPPVLLFSTYLNLSGFTVDSAGLTAAWSGLYLLLARRRTVAGASFGSRIGNKFGARGLTRGAAMILAGANVAGGGITYAFGQRNRDGQENNGV
jgi:hypothetical protein